MPEVYDVHSQAEEYTSADAEVMELMDQHDKEKLDDPLAKLEHGNAIMARKKAQNARLLDLKDDSTAKYKNDYAMNKLLRKNLRYASVPWCCSYSMRATWLGQIEHCTTYSQLLLVYL